MKNTKKEIGGFKIHRPELVIKLALVMDDYKFCIRKSLWEESEAQAKKNLHKFDPSTMFYEEHMRQPGKKLVYSFRYYTPPENLERITK